MFALGGMPTRKLRGGEKEAEGEAMPEPQLCLRVSNADPLRPFDLAPRFGFFEIEIDADAVYGTRPVPARP